MEQDTAWLDCLPRGMYFGKKSYDEEQDLLTWDTVEDMIPLPYIVSHPAWTSCYQYALKILFKNIHKPNAGTGFVSNFIDAAFNKDIFLWDTCFMSMFCNLLSPFIPGICSLDNFYCKQFDDGEIPREMVRDTGKDFLLWTNRFHAPLYSQFHNHYKFRGLSTMTDISFDDLYKPNLGRTPEEKPYLTLDNLNHPLLAWAEWESWKQTGNTKRLSMVIESLWHYYKALHYHLRHTNNLYVTDWASMDNSPRNKGLALGVDISSEMVLFANNLISIMDVLEKEGFPVIEKQGRTEQLIKEKNETAQAIQNLMWDEKTKFFYDLDQSMHRIPIKTAAAFWTILSGVATKSQQEALCIWLEDKKTFNRPHRVPSLAADEPTYEPEGGYWRGSVWTPLNTMIIRGLQETNHYELARTIALNDIDCVSKVFLDTGTIWENYSADFITKGNSDHPDLVGWSGMAPILFFIQLGIGLETANKNNGIIWHLDDQEIATGPIGCKRYWWKENQADFDARIEGQKSIITIRTKNKFPLTVIIKGLSKEYFIQGNATIIWNT